LAALEIDRSHTNRLWPVHKPIVVRVVTDIPPVAGTPNIDRPFASTPILHTRLKGRVQEIVWSKESLPVILFAPAIVANINYIRSPANRCRVIGWRRISR